MATRAAELERSVGLGYEDFVNNPNSLLAPRSQTPFTWSPENEYPIYEYQFSNGARANLALDPKLAGLNASAALPFGRVDHPGAHPLEHLMRNSRDIPGLDHKLGESILGCNGITQPQRLAYTIGVNTSDAYALAGRNPDFTSQMVYLLFTMLGRIDLQQHLWDRDRNRLVDESDERQNSPILRLYDRALPLITLGEGYQLPSVELETSFSLDELKVLHSRLPFGSLNLNFTGNPQERFSGNTPADLDKAAGRIFSAAEETFGNLPDTPNPQVAEKKTGGFFQRLGTRVSVVTSGEMAGNILGTSLVTINTGNTKKDYAERLFVQFLKNALFRELYDTGLMYKSYFSGSDYHTKGFETDFMGISTSRPSETATATLGVLEKVISGDRSPDLLQAFEDAKESQVKFYFQVLNLFRLESARKLGLSTVNNCQALYELIQSTKFAEVVESGRQIEQSNRLGIIHYGRSQLKTRGFKQVYEGSL